MLIDISQIPKDLDITDIMMAVKRLGLEFPVADAHKPITDGLLDMLVAEARKSAGR